MFTFQDTQNRPPRKCRFARMYCELWSTSCQSNYKVGFLKAPAMAALTSCGSTCLVSGESNDIVARSCPVTVDVRSMSLAGTVRASVKSSSWYSCATRRRAPASGSSPGSTSLLLNLLSSMIFPCRLLLNLKNRLCLVAVSSLSSLLKSAQNKPPHVCR